MRVHFDGHGYVGTVEGASGTGRNDDERRQFAAAGFRLESYTSNSRWVTVDPRAAERLCAYMDMESRRRLASDLEALEAKEQRAREDTVVKTAASRAVTSDIKVAAPVGLDYMPFQKAGIDFVLSRPNTLLADEMGLGKTIQAVGTINMDETINRILVVCPASIKINWKRELERWLVRPLTIVIVGSKDSCDEDEANIIILNYEALPKALGLYREDWDFLIVDECHYIKNSASRRSRYVSALRARKRLFITGTPIVNRPIELWPIIRNLDPQNWHSERQFEDRYCAPKEEWWGRDVKGAANLEELQDRLRSTIMIRRLKSQVLPELPPKFRQVIELPADGIEHVLAAEQEALARHKQRLASLRLAVSRARASTDAELYAEAVRALKAGIRACFEEISVLRHKTAVAKVPYVVDHVKNVLEAGNKVVCFAHHRDVIAKIAGSFRGRSVVLTGQTPLVERQAAIDSFQNTEACRLFIGSITAAGIGITLTASSHVIFAELDWVPGNIVQAEDRCHRIGQPDSVLVQHLVLEGSLDSTMAKMLISKQEVIEAALDSPTGVSGTEYGQRYQLLSTMLSDFLLEPQGQTKFDGERPDLEEVFRTVTANQG